jgi:hypothetical protein
LRGYTPNSQYVWHSCHVFSKDQLSWRYSCWVMKLSSFTFSIYFPLFVWCTFNMFLPKINCLGDLFLWSKFFYFLDTLFICSMVDINMSLPKTNCLGEVVIWHWFCSIPFLCSKKFCNNFLFISFKSVIDLRVWYVFKTGNIGDAHSERLIVFNTP